MFTNFFQRFSPLQFVRRLIRNPKTRLFTIVVVVIYLISPFDLIPDFIPFVGWIDDALLASILFSEIANIIKARQING